MTGKPEDMSEPVQQSAPEQAAGLNPRVRLGEALSRARQARGISINDASERLRIRAHYLEAMESGDWACLPEEVYVMGFLRQYASLLGVDISNDIAALKTGEYQLTKPFTMPDPPIAMSRAWAIAAGACFVLLLILFNVMDEGEKEQIPPPGALSLTAPDSATPEQPSKQASVAKMASDTAPEAAPSAEAQAPAAGAMLETPVEAQPAPADTAPAPKAAATAAAAAQAEPPAADADTATGPGGPASGSHDYQISAVDEDVWLQVHAPDGSLLKEALLRSGQSMRLSSADAYLLLTAGNPLALRVSIDDKIVAETGTLGDKKHVLRDHHLIPTDSGSAR